MMKKKLFSLAVTLVMALSLAVPAMAATVDSGMGGDGSITVNDAKIGATYNVYKVFDATYGDGNTAAYEVDGGSVWYTELASKNVFDFDLIPGTTTYRVSSDASGAEIGAALGEVLATAEPAPTPAAEAITTTEEDTEVVWTGLSDGYYLVVSDVKDAAEAVVSLTNVENDVIVYEKNEGPGWGDGGKEIVVNGETTEVTSVNYGDVVTYQLTINATNYDGYDKIQSYTVYDNLPDGMALVEGSVSYTVNGGQKMTDATVGDSGGVDAGAYDFSITIPWQQDGDFIYPNNDNTIVVTYQATVTSEAAVSTALINNAWFGWNDGKDGGSSTTDKATVYTYAVAIQKIDGTTHDALQGVKFKVSKGDKYVVAPNGVFSKYTTNPAEATEFTTDDNGQIIIKGLEVGDYTFTETYALPGYSVADPETVTATLAGETTTTVTVYFDAEGNIVDEGQSTTSEEYTLNVSSFVEVIANYTGTTLPGTGGMGTTIFYVVGGTLVVAAAVLLITKKRMHNVEG